MSAVKSTSVVDEMYWSARPACRLLAAVCALAFALALLTAGPALAASPAWRIQAAVGPTHIAPRQSQVVRVSVEAAGGTFTITGSETTAPIPFDASAAEVQSALEGEPALGPGSVVVTGGPGGAAEAPYFLTFAGPLAKIEVGDFSADGSALTGSGANAHAFTTVPGGPGTGMIEVQPANIGGLATSGRSTMLIGPLPDGISATGPAEGALWTCEPEAADRTFTCFTEEEVGPLNQPFPVVVPIEVESDVETRTTVPVVLSGGGTSAPATDQAVVTVSDQPAAPGVVNFFAGAFDADGQPVTQAGAHPYSGVTGFLLSTRRGPTGRIEPVGDSKEVDIDLPPGFVGNPLVTPRCPPWNFAEIAGPTAFCTPESNVGTFSPSVSGFGYGPIGTVPIKNDVPARGYAAQFMTAIATPLQTLIGSLRTEEDFGVRITAPNNPTYSTIYGSFAALGGDIAGAHGKAFLTNPSDCAVQREEAAQGRGPWTRMTTTTWQESSIFAQIIDPLPLLTGCGALTEAWLGHGPEPANEVPSFGIEPDTTQGSSPTGATASLHIPQANLLDPAKLAPANLKKTVVTLPQGLTVNPSSANGLAACSEAQVGYIGDGFPSPNPMHFNNAPVSCPDGAKLGTFQIKSPLLEEEVPGTIYLAAQEQNPFGSLIALYLVVESERFGITLKLPGKVEPDPQTGQLTATFDNNPQLPFEDLTLHFRGGGQRATLATPEVCGHYEATGSLEPWSAENGEALPIHEAGFDTAGGCSSSAGGRPFAPSFEAGTTGTQAGAYSPLVIKVGRKDGEQELKSLDFTLPKGLVGKLAGITYCPESSIRNAESKSGKAEQASASCPASSEMGSVDTSAGVGSEPIHVGGKVYLAGPYKGAPLSSVVVTPAVAGPFDLGDVVIRAPLYVNPETAEITAKSDPIPTILKGIPLKVRSVAINLDRSDFTLNPTSCEVMLVTASFQGSSGGSANSSNRFQVGGCNALKFKPKLKISLKGPTKRAGLPSLKAVVTYPKRGAYSNIARAQVNLPHSEFIEQNNLDKTCTKPVLLEGKCTKRSIYGRAKAWTPLLDKPLEGPVYLVGGYGYKLPALVAELNGQIRVILKGKVDSGPNKGIRNTFEAVPDAPVSRFVLEMKGGKKYGLLVNSENLCRKPQRAIARFTAQNGLVDQTRPLVRNQCGKKTKSKDKRKHKGKGGKPKPKKS